MKSEHKWFMDAKLGMFIHWGLYAIRSQEAWAIYREQIDKKEYKDYQRRFNPTRFNAEAWVNEAKNAGMKYMVVTSKHHDGFCMYDSHYTDWKVTNTPFGRDVIQELSDACRSAGLGFGIYYSIWDMWHPGLDGGLNTSMGGDGEFDRVNRSNWKPSEEGVTYMHNQVEELCTRYGKVDLFWFDVKRASGEDYRGKELLAKMRSWQPAMLINDRLGIEADLKTPENHIPEQGLTDQEGNPILWESCMCFNQNWGYVRDDFAYKTPDQVIQQLVEVVSKGGNMLLNVGPNALGEFPKPYYPELLSYLGEWMSYHGESIYDTRVSEVQAFHHFRWQAFCTQSAHKIYLHITQYPISGKIVFPKLTDKTLDYAYLMIDGTEVRWEPVNYLTLNANFITLQLPIHQLHSAVTTVVMVYKSGEA